MGDPAKARFVGTQGNDLQIRRSQDLGDSALYRCSLHTILDCDGAHTLGLRPNKELRLRIRKYIYAPGAVHAILVSVDYDRHLSAAAVDTPFLCASHPRFCMVGIPAGRILHTAIRRPIYEFKIQRPHPTPAA